MFISASEGTARSWSPGTAIDMEREKLGGLSRAQVALIVGLLIVVAVVWLLGDGGMNSFSE